MLQTESPVRWLEQRVATSGARPLMTWYDVASGARIELSGTTFANWVDKTVNLMAALGIDEHADVGLPLLTTDPYHWVPAVWTMAVWQFGGRVIALPRSELPEVDLAVVGPGDAHPVPGAETVACSLHPLGGPLRRPVAGVIDYHEVLSEADVHWVGAPAGGAADGDRWAAASFGDVAPSGRRLLLTDAAPASRVRDLVATALVAPLAGGGSTVLVSGRPRPDQTERIVRDEHAELS